MIYTIITDTSRDFNLYINKEKLPSPPRRIIMKKDKRPRRGKDEIMTETKISAVSVYRNACLITRSATLALKEGSQTVRLLGPGRGTDASSLRLSVPEGVQGSNVQMEYLNQKTRDEESKTLRLKKEKLLRDITDTKEQIELWKTNADFSEKENLSIQEMSQFLEALPGRIAALNEKLDALLLEQEALEKEWNKLQEGFNKPYVLAELTADKAGEYPVELQYKDENAAWAPAYELHTRDDDEESLLLRLRARVAQYTGEDWKQVRLALFSGNPSVSGTIPSLNPVRVHFYEEPRFNGLKMRSAVMSAAAPAAEEAMDTVAEEDAPVFAAQKMSQVMAGSGQTVQGDTMTEYTLNGLWDIQDGQDIICDIRTDSLPCRYQVVAVPRLSGSAYLAAVVKTADLEEMNGVEAAVYLKGAFAGNVYLEPDMSQDEYNLSLGQDETVKIKRTQKKRFSSQVLLKGQRKTEFEYELSVSSRKPGACRVLLKDQIPVSEEKSIQIETQNLSGGEAEEKTGIISWEFDLAPGESRKLELAYSVAWPKDKSLSGI